MSIVDQIMKGAAEIEQHNAHKDKDLSDALAGIPIMRNPLIGKREIMLVVGDEVYSNIQKHREGLQEK